MSRDPVFLLDLCILAYKLHAQSLYWPMDPYFEQMQRRGAKVQGATPHRKRRKAFMEQVRDAYSGTTLSLSNVTLPRGGKRGPAFLHGQASHGWKENRNLDPVLHGDYVKVISPYRPGIVRPSRNNDGWIVYTTPPSITDRIRSVYVASFDANDGPSRASSKVNIIKTTLQPVRTDAKDALYCFEGGTGGDSQDAGFNWSLMGCVLKRRLNPSDSNDKSYDVFICFRGSRSGTLRPSQSKIKSRGNPDWVTDLDQDMTERNVSVSPKKFYNGFAQATMTFMPTLLGCLQQLHTYAGRPPRAIYVTGHSLGGALAVGFASAMRLGEGLKIAKQRKLDDLKDWPWHLIDVTTFGAPGTGNIGFKRRIDSVAAIRNIRLDRDIVAKNITAKHIGADVVFSTWKGMGDAHEPLNIRKKLVEIVEPVNGGEILFSEETTSYKDNYKAEPWVVCETLVEALERIAVPNGQLQDVIPKFTVGLEEYVRIYAELVNASSFYNVGIPGNESKKAADAQDLISLANALQANPPKNFEETRGAWELIATASVIRYDDSLARLFREWLLLAAIENGYGFGQIVQNPDDRGLKRVTNWMLSGEWQ